MKKIIIVGGGSAGWMTAATLIKTFPDKDITVIESPKYPTIGVGESTLGRIRNWMEYLGIDEKSFMKATDASFKLSIKFTDFYKKGESFHYPFGEPLLHNCNNGINDWWVKKIFKPELDHNDYTKTFYPNMTFINENIFCNEPIEELNWYPKHQVAYHFDAIKFGQYLKNEYCLPKGVKYIQEDIQEIKQNENGIESLNGKYNADLFIDCSGFKGLLINETLKEPFESYDDILINDSAWAIQIPYQDKEKELVAYTNCTAIENGWVWRAPLWSRIGTGYVYSSKFVKDEDALEQFKKHLNIQEGNFRNIKIPKVGIHKRIWVKNVVAIGLSSGFLEPLESNGLFAVHEFVMKLIRNIQRENVSQWDRDNFNYSCKKSFRAFAEFIALHYALSHRNDTGYWKHMLNKEWCENLINLTPPSITGFQMAANDRDINFTYDTRGGFHCIAAGMHWAPTDLPTLIYENADPDLEKWKINWEQNFRNLSDKKFVYKTLIKEKAKVSLKQYLEENIYND